MYEDRSGLVDGNTTGPFGNEIGVEDDDPRGAAQSFGDRGPRLHGDFEAFRSPISEPMGEQG
jgi:hypothetical protein